MPEAERAVRAERSMMACVVSFSTCFAARGPMSLTSTPAPPHWGLPLLRKLGGWPDAVWADDDASSGALVPVHPCELPQDVRRAWCSRQGLRGCPCMQAIMVLVLVFSVVVLGLHMYITRRFPAIPAVALPEETEEPQLASKQVQSSASHRLSLAPDQVTFLEKIPKFCCFGPIHYVPAADLSAGRHLWCGFSAFPACICS